MQNPLRIFPSLLCFLFLTCDANGLAKTDTWFSDCETQKCEAVIDAGSSGTRLHVFQKSSDSSVVREIFQHKIEPGLSQIEPDALATYLIQLFPLHDNISIDTYFYATAGMRLLPQEKQDAYYEIIKSWFDAQNTWQLKDVRTITGQEEGAFAWLAVNHGHTIDNMQAVIEFGGASAQINIPISPDKKELIPEEELISVMLGDQKVDLWSRSYLGLGINEVEKRVGEQQSCYSSGYPLKNGLMAYGDASSCILGIESNTGLSLLKRLDDAKSLLTIMKQPLHWMALGSLYYTAMKPPFKFAEYEFSLDELKHQADEFSCHQNWSNLFTQYHDDPFLYRNCFAASYFYAYMADGMGIDVHDRIRYPENNQTMDWAFGVVLTHQA